jgi:predicted amidophosphoribosyltransferase
MRYDEASRSLTLAFKHGDRLPLAPSFGGWLKRAGAERAAAADIAVPVPLHWTRLFARRYNQAALLAHALHAAGGPPVASATPRSASAMCAPLLRCGRAARSPASASC